MSMYIENLHVENVGPFNKLDVQFNPKMNVIIGSNGVGKTSLLRCLTYSMTSNSLDNIRFRKDAVIKANGVNGEKKYTFGAEKIVNENQKYRQINITRWLLTPDEGRIGEIMHKEKDYNLLAIGAYRYFSYKQIGGMTREGNVKELRNLYQANNPRYLEAQPMPDIKQWMINRYFQIEKEWATIEKTNWKWIISKLNTMAPKGSLFEFVKIERDLEPIFNLNGSECYLEELSSGFKSILSIVFNITDWIEGVNEKENSDVKEALGTVMIDEIDAHLHPSWQSTILSSLRLIFPKLQFIVTTHSPNVIMSANAGEVLVFNNIDGNVDMKPDEREFGAWQFNDILSDIMQAPGLDRIGVVDQLAELNKAYAEKNIQLFQELLASLERVLNQNDSILKVYKLRLSELLLNV